MNKKQGGNLLSGLLIGAAVGTAYSMLFAQKKGKDLRGELKSQMKDPKKALGTVLEQYKDAGAESTKLAKEFVKTPEVQEAFSQLKGVLEPIFNKFQDKGGIVADLVREYMSGDKEKSVKKAVKKAAPVKKAPAAKTGKKE